MPGHGTDGLGVAFAPGDALIETTDVTVGGAPAPDADRVGRFDEGPLEVVVDVGAEPSEAGLPAAGVDAGVVPA